MRRADARILRRVAKAVGGAASVLNIGAGTGGYEPPDRRVVTIEASEAVIKRRAKTSAPVVKGEVERLPFKDRSFAASMSILTIQHWGDPVAGVREMARVSSRRAVVFTLDPEVFGGFWLYRYFSDAAFLESMRYPKISAITAALGGDVRVETVPIPFDCRDGFIGAYWRRPSLYLEQRVRRTIATLQEIGDDNLLDGLRRLSEDLASGAWESANGWLLQRDEIDLGYRLIVAEYSPNTDQ
jgi:SAM-dependent methyltransferase